LEAKADGTITLSPEVFFSSTFSVAAAFEFGVDPNGGKSSGDGPLLAP
jgi:hypothetical protein